MERLDPVDVRKWALAGISVQGFPEQNQGWSSPFVLDADSNLAKLWRVNVDGCYFITDLQDKNLAAQIANVAYYSWLHGKDTKVREIKKTLGL
jgi:hypothetical protein